ncbi:MAG: nuclear transport factor 2 family protein [Haloarcula sp.]
MTRDSRLRRAQAYYDAIDGDDYDRLASLLAPDFVHDRPDRTIDGRERFVQFMREERPQTDTTHPLDGLYCSYDEGSEPTDSSGDTEETEVVARGRLLDADGERITRFVDVFTFADGAIERIETYTR